MKFLQEKPSRFLIETLKAKPGNPSSSDIGLKIDTTYAHAVKIAQTLEDNNLIKRKKIGRKKEIHLTNEGEQIAEKLKDLNQLLINFQEAQEV